MLHSFHEVHWYNLNGRLVYLFLSFFLGAAGEHNPYGDGKWYFILLKCGLLYCASVIVLVLHAYELICLLVLTCPTILFIPPIFVICLDFFLVNVIWNSVVDCPVYPNFFSHSSPFLFSPCPGWRQKSTFAPPHSGRWLGYERVFFTF